ncbi:Rhodanese-related sulfurtransferase [Desulfocurvibacter africanus PCS]|uniref:Rhodanese-related sulfurtransferase n=1 Tax=Desulfocurvibacter africanus PCS TaxID=1262666 RepID=M5Q0P0_DESAF|nr:rhodanese-like domain-containing protein [Desulfocurvibacter africanus]EMG35848.1 Rhodanese-related sulfurtransferase [Desulfocurvibacter africanus PCS]
MNTMRKQLTLLAVLATLLGLVATGCAAKSEAGTPAQAAASTSADGTAGELSPPSQTPAWYYKDLVDSAFIEQYVKMPRPENVLIIDSRPYKTKHALGYIPTSVSIPDSEFDKRTAELPKNKDALLIFYCEGYACKLSHNSAKKAEALGYTNVKVYAGGYPVWKSEGRYTAIGTPVVEEMMASGKPYLLVDARPFKTKFQQGSIPTAISLPDSDFEARKGQLPADKSIPLVFFCEGFTCKLSNESARKAEKLGYTNIMVYEAGYPAWVEAHGSGSAPVTTASSANEGAIAVAQFEQTLKNNPGSIVIVDVRDADEFKAGHFKNARNIPVAELEKQLKSMPKDKPVVFVCSTGARSGEAYWMARDVRPDMDKVYFLDATVTYAKDGAYSIKAPKK